MFEVGTELPRLEIGEITREQITEYSRVSHDPNPMHTDEQLAQSAGYPSVFAQGMLGMGFLSRYLVETCGVGKLRQIKVRFKTMTWPGETVTCSAKITDVNTVDGVRLVSCDLHTENQNGEPKVVGSAVFEA